MSSPDDFTGPPRSDPTYGYKTGSEGTTMRMIFVNLPVEDLRASRAFFTALGFEFNTAFSDASCACMVVDRNIFVMLLVRRRFGDFVIGRIADATAVTEVIICLSAESRQQVDDTVARAIAAGGKPWQPTVEDGPMYGGSFQDLDGHVWELVHMAEA
jgi:predicted lactoylglutathione lyase